MVGIVLTEYDWDWSRRRTRVQACARVEPELRARPQALCGVPVVRRPLRRSHRRSAAGPSARSAGRRDEFAARFVLYRARRYEDALAALQPAIELDPDHPTPYLAQGLALSMLGRHAEAIAALEKGVETSKRSTEMLAQLALACGRAGLTDRANKLLSELEARAGSQHVSPFAFALVHTGLGDPGKAMAALERAYQQREWYLCVLKVDPIFDPLRGDPRFQDLLRRLHLPG